MTAEFEAEWNRTSVLEVCLSTNNLSAQEGRPSFISLRWAQLSSVLLDSKVTPFYSPAVKIPPDLLLWPYCPTLQVKPWFPKNQIWASPSAWPGNLLERHIIYGPYLKPTESKTVAVSLAGGDPRCMLSSIIMALWHYNHLTTVNSWETKAFLLGTCSLGLYSLPISTKWPFPICSIREC